MSAFAGTNCTLSAFRSSKPAFADRYKVLLGVLSSGFTTVFSVCVKPQDVENDVVCLRFQYPLATNEHTQRQINPQLVGSFVETCRNGRRSMGWSYIHSNLTGEHQEGPVSDQQAMELLAERKINTKTRINHPDHTGGKWTIGHQCKRFMELAAIVQRERNRIEREDQRLEETKRDRMRQQIESERNDAMHARHSSQVAKALGYATDFSSWQVWLLPTLLICASIFLAMLFQWVSASMFFCSGILASALFQILRQQAAKAFVERQQGNVRLPGVNRDPS